MVDNASGAWDLVKYYLEPIEGYFTMDGVSEIRVNRYDKIFIERNGQKELTEAKFADEQTLQTAIMQIANALEQVANPDTHPTLDARLPDGSRVNATLHPIAVFGSNMTIRLFPKERFTGDKLVQIGSLTQPMLEYLRLAVMNSANMLVSGSTGSGKTTLLNVISAFIPRNDRVLTAEDTKELQVDVDDLVMYEAPRRRKNLNIDSQNIDLSALIKTMLRNTPDRILVGEIRDTEAAMSFLQAINTGHDGTCSTIHANNSSDALTRLQTLIAFDGSIPWQVVEVMVRSNLNVLVHAGKSHKFGRKVTQICELQNGELSPLWEFNFVTGEHDCFNDNLSQSLVVKSAKKHGLTIPPVLCDI